MITYDLVEDNSVWISVPPDFPYREWDSFDEWFDAVSEVYWPSALVSPEHIEEVRQSVRAIEINQGPGFIGAFLHADSPLKAPLVVLGLLFAAEGDVDLREAAGAYDSELDREPVVDSFSLPNLAEVVRVLGVESVAGEYLRFRLSYAGHSGGWLLILAARHRDSRVLSHFLPDVDCLMEGWEIVDIDIPRGAT